MNRETFNADQVRKLSEELEKAPDIETSKMSKADVLRMLEPTLRRLRTEKGYTLQDLATLLVAKGLSVKVSTLQGALKKKGTGKKREKVVTKTEPAPPAAPQEKLDGAIGIGDLNGIASKPGKKVKVA